MKIKITAILMLLLLFVSSSGTAQTEVSLDSLFAQAQRNYPLWKQKKLIEQKAALNEQNIRSNYKPQLKLVGQATYQTDVTAIELDIPFINIDMPELPKDQYKINVELHQILYDGGLTKVNIKLAGLQSESEIAKNEAAMYQLYEKIAGLFFKYLLLDESKASLNASQELLNSNLKVLKSAVDEGVGSRNDLDNLKAESINLEASLLEIEFAKSSIAQSIEILTGKQLPTNFHFTSSETELQIASKYTRPEFNLFEKQHHLLTAQTELLTKSRMPKAFAFSQVGYGKPGLNMFSESFDSYGIIGVGINWNIYDWGNTKRKKQHIDIQHEDINLQKNLLTQNLDLLTTQTTSELEKIQQLIAKEEEIIAIRERVLERTSDQLKNGTITSNQYLDDLNKLTLASIKLARLKIEWQQQQLNYKIQTGEILN